MNEWIQEINRKIQAKFEPLLSPSEEKKKKLETELNNLKVKNREMEENRQQRIVQQLRNSNLFSSASGIKDERKSTH